MGPAGAGEDTIRRFQGALLASLLIFLTSCASDKVPAEQALKAAETAVAAVQAEAAKWVPDQAKALAEATKGWSEAPAAYTGGNVNEALAKAQVVKQKAVEALEALGMPVPPAAKS